MANMEDYINSRNKPLQRIGSKTEIPEFKYGLYTEEEGVLPDEQQTEERQFPEKIRFGTLSEKLIPDSIRQRFPSQSPVDELFKGVPGGVDGAIGVADAVLGTVSQIPSVAGSMYGTVEGIVDSVSDGTFGTQEGANKAFDQMQKRTADVSEYLYQPRSEAGNKLMENLSKVSDRYAPPLLSGGVAPLMQPNVPKISKGQETAERIRRGDEDADLAGKRIPDSEGFDAGRAVVRDSEAVSVIKQGFEPKTLQMIKQATPADKKRMLEMIRLRQEGLTNLRSEQQDGPAKVIGEEFKKGALKIKTDLQDAGKQVNRASLNLKGIPIPGAVNIGENFKLSLKDVLNVDFDPQTGARNYNNSTIQMTKGLQTVLDNIIGKVSGWEKKGDKIVFNPNFKLDDAFDLHILKKAISELVSYEKQKDGVTGATESVVKDLRRNIDTYLDNLDLEYDQANQRFSALKNADDSLMDVIGKKADLGSEFVSDRLAKISRRLASGGINVDQLRQAIFEMQELGAFKDTDLLTIMLFAEKMDDALGQPSKMNSFLASTKRAMEGAATNQNATTAAMDLAKSGVDAMRGINEKNLLEATKRLLLRDLNENKRRESKNRQLPVKR
jgi:hypothetical protein